MTSESLTPREREVAELLAAGLTNAQIAATLVVSVYTAASHTKAIVGKLGAQNRTHAAMLYVAARDGTTTAAIALDPRDAESLRKQLRQGEIHHRLDEALSEARELHGTLTALARGLVDLMRQQVDIESRSRRADRERWLRDLAADQGMQLRRSNALGGYLLLDSLDDVESVLLEEEVVSHG